MISIIANGEYTLNATAKTIQLTNTTIKKENIRKIIGVDSNIKIYDSEIPKSGKNINLDSGTPGLFHYDYGGVPSGETLQITIFHNTVDGGSP